eukprot:scaffold23395_cov34-Cyclotella_meneghiniana.AAC.1
MGFFRKKKDATPLSSTMYQGDNSTPARSSGGKSTPLTPDTLLADDSAIATEAKKTKKRGLLFGRKNEKTERYVKVTPDTKDSVTEDHQQIHMMQQTPEENAEMTRTLPITRDTGTVAATQDVNEAEHSSPPDEKMTESKRNLNADFTQEDDGDYDPLDKENKKFMNRFRTSWRKGSNNRHNNTNMEQKLMAQKLIEQQQKNKAGTTSPVPKLIDQSDGASVPSLITEMTGQSNLKRRISTEGGISNEKQSVAITKLGNNGAVTTTSQMQSFFGPPDSFSRQPRQELTMGEKFLNLLSCGDTASLDNNGYFGRIKCLDLCGPLMMGGEKDDALRLAREEEDKFVIQFMNELTKHGIKLIYHKPPPTITDSTSDWTQITVKMFLRPGSCHDIIQHPKLAWASLPVASRTILTGSYDVNHPSANNEEEEWTYQSLTDVYSILGAEDDANTTSLGISTNPSSCELDSSRGGGGGIIGGETSTRETASHTKDHTTATYDETATNDYTTNQSTTSGFFSITAGSTGNVHVFEAPTGSRRDYIVTGLKKLIRRASYQLISGSLNVCAELYGEDSTMPMMSGELPSLVTPTQALRYQECKK